MRNWIREAAIAAVFGFALLAPVFAGGNPAKAGVSLGDFCGD